MKKKWNPMGTMIVGQYRSTSRYLINNISVLINIFSIARAPWQPGILLDNPMEPADWNSRQRIPVGESLLFRRFPMDNN